MPAVRARPKDKFNKILRIATKIKKLKKARKVKEFLLKNVNYAKVFLKFFALMRYINTQIGDNQCFIEK